MKYLPLIIIVFFYACNSEPEKIDDNPTSLDSNSAERKFFFSKNEDENKVYGSINFGISADKFKIVNQTDTVLIAGKDNYLLTPFFNKYNELYKIQFIGVDTLTNFLSPADLKDSTCFANYLERFLNSIIEKYGETGPSISSYEATDWIRWYYIWEKGNKIIRLGIKTEKRGFRVVCWISNKIEEENNLIEVDLQNKKNEKIFIDSVKKSSSF